MKSNKILFKRVVVRRCLNIVVGQSTNLLWQSIAAIYKNIAPSYILLHIETGMLCITAVRYILPSP